MDISNFTEEEKKLFNLFLSGTEPNDLLVIEIIKKSNSIRKFIKPLITIILTTKNEKAKFDILKYLKPHIKAIQFDYLKYQIEKYNYDEINPQTLLQHFTAQDICDFAYIDYRRRGKSLDHFLSLDDGNHPERAILFQKFLESHFDYRSTYLTLPGLTKEEIEVVMNKRKANSNLSHIYMLTIESSKVKEMPDNLFLNSVQYLNIQFRYGTPFFPSYVFKFKDLKTLNLEINKDIKLPNDWSGLNELTELAFSGERYLFDNFDFIETLPKLRSLTTGRSYIKHPNVLLRKKKIPLSGYIQFLSTEGYQIESAGHTIRFCEGKAMGIASALGKSILEKEEQQQLFKKILHLKKIKNLEKLSLDDLLALMNVNQSDLRNVAQKQLDALSEKQKGIKTLNENTLLYIAGTPSRKKTEIKQKLKELNIRFTNDPTQGITHLVVCKSPKKYKQLQGREIALISEQALYQMFKEDAPGFLEEAVQSGNDNLASNIKQFLYSDDTPNVLVGLEMLKNGGVPPELIDPLLVVFKTCPDAKARKLAKTLLQRNAPADLLPTINDSQRFTNLHGKVKAQDINNKLAKLARTASRKSAAKLALLFHERFQKGLRYILYHFHEPCEERTLALKAMMEGTHLNYSRGLGFSNHKEKDPSTIYLSNLRIPAKFPMDAIEQIPNIDSASFHNCKLNSLPARIGDWKNLKRLDLSHNFLKTFPKSFSKLENLEYLNLQMNAFPEFPNILFKLKNLKVLDLRYNRLDYDFKPVEITDEVKEAMAECEILV